MAVLFDLDGTLLDTSGDILFAVNDFATKNNLRTLSHKEFRPYVGKGIAGILENFYDLSDSHPDFLTYKQHIIECYRANIDNHTRLFIGIPEVLDYLEKSNITWGIVTNKITSLTIPLLKSFGLDTRAKTIVCCDTTPYFKPHPAPVLHACSEIGVDPSKTVFIGDSINDILAGNSAGTKTIAALYGFIGDLSTTEQWDYTAKVDEPHEITTIIEQWIANGEL